VAQPAVVRDPEGRTFLSSDPRLMPGVGPKALGKYVTITSHDSQWVLTSRGRYAGLLTVGSIPVYLPPPVPPATFLGMLLIAHGLDSVVDADRVLGPSRSAESFQDIMEVLAALMVMQAERLAAGHIAQGYLRRQERLPLVRGRPLWHTVGAYPPDGRIMCRFSDKTTDVLLNRLVLLGVTGARRYLRSTAWQRRQRTQQFVWASLAEPTHMSRVELQVARQQINRLTSPYEGAIDLVEMLVFGDDPAPRLYDPRRSVPMPLFDLAYLFEHLVTRLVQLAVDDRGWLCKSQATEAQALTDGTGATYRRIRPDQLLYGQSGLLAVIDSKFKPRYASYGPALVSQNRVSREDIYQVFFYAERLRRIHALTTPLPAFLAAPWLPNATPPDVPQRQVVWSDSHDVATNRLVVVPVDVVASVTSVLRRDGDAARLLVRDVIAEVDGAQAMSPM
jgi:McrBC 5-methylcytosine restriction system component